MFLNKTVFVFFNLKQPSQNPDSDILVVTGLKHMNELSKMNI
jgi:hypothetical protein